MIVKFTDNFLMIRGLITVLSALKMRNFTLIFLKKILGGNPQPSVLGAFPTPPTKLASCAPAYINLTIKFSIMYKVCLLLSTACSS